MNAEPHTHTPRLQKHYANIGQGPWEIVYGDTKVRVCAEWRSPTPRQVKRATQRAIRKHDRGSVQAGQIERVMLEAALPPMLEEKVDVWPSGIS